MRTGIAISGTLHVVAIAATVLGLPLFQPSIPTEEQPLLVELVTVAEQTTSQPQPKAEDTPPTPPTPEKTAKADPPTPPPEPAAKPEPIAKKPEPPAPKPERKELVAPPAPEPDPVAAKPPEPEPAKPEPEPEPKPVAEPEPEKPAPEPEKKPLQVAEKTPEPEAKPEPEPPAPSPFANAPTPRAKPKPEPERPAFDASRIAALLDKSQKKEKKPLLERLASKVAGDQPSKPAPKARLSDQPLTMSEIDAIRYQIEQCWSVPAGARDAAELIVRIRVFFNPDGSLSRTPEIVDRPPGEDDFYRTAAESARRAVQKCAPLKHLPPDKYERWREVVLTFNPRQMLGG